MNKKLLAVAIGAAFASAPMFANAAATVYGLANVSIDRLDDGQTTDNEIMTLSSNASYIGFKAEDDLGGGMKGLVGIEFGFAFDNTGTNAACTNAACTTTTNASTINNYNVFAGLSGGFGTVRLGNYDDIMKQVGRSVDFFVSRQLGESRSMTAGNGMDARLANSVNYESPKLGPVMITFNYGLATDAQESIGQDLTAMALGVQANFGGVYVGAAYKLRDIDAGASTDATTGMRVSAAFTMGPFKVGGLYQKFENDFAVVSLDVYGVGASFKIGNGTIKGQYYSAGESASGAANGATLMAIGYDHSLSKTTTVYVAYAQIENDLTGGYSLISPGHSNPQDIVGFNPIANGTNSGLSAGVAIAF